MPHHLSVRSRLLNGGSTAGGRKPALMRPHNRLANMWPAIDPAGLPG